MSMRFEARDLDPWADHVRPADLVEGQVYFRVGFIDRDMVVPQLEAIAFLGRDFHSGGVGLYFQDAASYLQGYRFALADVDPFPMAAEVASVTFANDDAWLEVERPREYSGVQLYDDALNSLLRCSLHRARWDGIVRGNAGGDS